MPRSQRETQDGFEGIPGNGAWSSEKGRLNGLSRVMGNAVFLLLIIFTLLITWNI